MRKISSHGGARPGAGRPQKYNEPTTYLGFKVPVSKADEVKKKILRILKKLEHHV